MKPIHSIFLFFLLIFSFCSQRENKVSITKKIQYDVNIKSVYANYDPWIENIYNQQRIEFVQNMLAAAYNGQVKAYDYFNQPMSLKELNNIGVDTIYKTLTRSYPPYEEFDTIIVNRLDIQDINKIRFLEEWYIDKEKLNFEKKVIGIALVIDKYDEEGNIIGKYPLFWVYPNGKPD